MPKKKKRKKTRKSRVGALAAAAAKEAATRVATPLGSRWEVRTVLGQRLGVYSGEAAARAAAAQAGPGHRAAPLR